jgi:hypothetical protein
VDIIHACPAHQPSHVSDRHVQKRSLKVGPALRSEINVVPPCGAVFAVPASERHVVSRIDADKVIRQGNQEQNAVKSDQSQGRPPGRNFHNLSLSNRRPGDSSKLLAAVPRATALLRRHACPSDWIWIK